MVSNPTEGNTALTEKTPYVITIAASEKPKDIKLRVAAYARVSTLSEDQKNSFEAQIVYYSTLISSKENWVLVDVYADEGVTGTSAEKRKDFQRLLSDCRRGLIDKILVKSISRFARNTKECLEAIRELKALGVSIYFEKENIETSQISGEMLTALFASFAQAESESISGNMRWSYQKRMENGSFNTCFAPYGYRLENGILTIQEDEAEAVRYIFTSYLNGVSIQEMLEYLEEHKRKKVSWSINAIEYILQNERYAGNALLQKKYTTETLPHKKLRNRGEKQMYFVRGSHAAIIPQEMYDQAQKLRQSRSKYRPAPNPRPYSKVMYCGICGGALRTKTIRGKVYMGCKKHEQSKKLCPLPHIAETEIHRAFLRLYDKLKHHSEILTQLIDGLQELRRRRQLWSTEIVEVNRKISELTSQNQMLASMKQQGLIDSDIFISQTNQLTGQLRAAKQERESLLEETGSNDTAEKTQDILDILEAGPEYPDSFDQELFHELVERIITENSETLKFRLRNGLELKETIEKVTQ